MEALLRLAILFTMLSTRTALAGDGVQVQKEKKSLNLHICGENQRQIMGIVNHSTGEIKYTIKPRLNKNYKIGAVFDGTHLILEDESTIIDRNVLFRYFTDGTRYIMVTTAKGGVEDSKVEITEMIKKTDDMMYMPLVRWPLDLNLVDQHDERFIKVTNGIKRGIIVYTTKNDMELDFFIGIVKYGRYIVDERVDGVLKKMIQVDKRRNPWIITISAFLNDGRFINLTYRIVGGIPMVSSRTGYY
ncbi:signal peptide containing protein [Theileria equi strain WA]|uniref:Signal peptide containing protein n=1 Tax=Theileria equi strain WA TaxID=1537102 RepID=L1L9Q6_THEEQ|nr:signal peptide containing protein [Theileria equi strain WA]EKX72231.1 signal peptide containing protein [Theileria equi strain WA]|eukprot:XP_004831683.1 signal peptide containing protein [Theileria equi strain WA]